MVDLEKIANPPDPGAAAQEQNARLLQMLLRGKWLILVLPILFAGGTWAYYNNKIPGFRVVPRYRATAKIQVNARIPDLLTGTSQAPDARLSVLARQQEQLFRSESVLRPLSENSEVAKLRTFQDLGEMSLIGALASGLSARTDSRTDQVAISFECSSRADAAVVADAAVEAYFGYHRQLARKKADEAAALLSTKREEIVAEHETINSRILELKQEHKIPYEDLRNPHASMLEAHTDSMQQALQDLHTAQVELRRVVKAAENQDTYLDYGTARRLTYPNTVLEGTISEYQRQRQDKYIEYEKKRPTYPEGSSILQNIEREMETLDREIDRIVLEYAEEGLRLARDDVQGLEQRYAMYEEKILEIEKDYFPMEKVLSDLRNLQIERALLQEQISEFGERIDDENVTGEAGALNIHVIENARVGYLPVYPETEKMTLMAALIGAFLGLSVVLVRGFIDRRIWSVEEVPNLLGADVVGVFPELLTRKRPKVGRIVEEDPASVAAEAIRSLRTSCSFGLPDNGKGVIFVTSSVSGEGKSVVASNLAIALAQSGRKTLLVDADLRAPGQNEIFAVIGKRGLGDVLAGEEVCANAIVRSVTADGMDLLPAGDASLGAAELVEGGACQQLFEQLRAEYDCVVVDSSPVLETAETRVLASLSNLTVFVMRMNRSTAPNSQRAVGILRSIGAEILGVMLNGAKTRRGAKAYAGGLTYGYGYGYGQYRAPGGPRSDMQEVASRAAPPTPDSRRLPAVGEIHGGG